MDEPLTLIDTAEEEEGGSTHAISVAEGSTPLLLCGDQDSDSPTDDSPRLVPVGPRAVTTTAETAAVAKNKKIEKLRGDSFSGSPLLDYVRSRSSPKLYDTTGSTADSPVAKKPVHRLGYVDTGPDELGAVPMRGKHRDDWLRIQATTFTNWVNDRLSGGDESKRLSYGSGGGVILDLKMDFEDGLLLIRLLENLTDRTLQGVVRNPIFTAQKIANLDVAFAFMRSEGVHLTAIGSQNVYEGNLKLIMGLIWTLIQHYQIMRRNTNVSAKELMINWIQSFMPGSNVTNFTSNWRDGRTLLSLIHEIKPDKAPSVTSLDPRKSLSNCTLAIRTAKIYLKVPPIISPDHLVSGELDELSMMTYLSYFVKPATKTVLRWVHEIIPQVKITNLTSDWNNGIALAALLNALFPGLFPKWKSLPRDKGEENIQQVFDIVREKCGIEPNLSANEMANPSIEELHVMTYILRMKHAKLLSLPEQIDVSGLGIKEARLDQQTHFFIDTTKAGSGSISVNAFYQDETAIKFSLTEKRPGVLKLVYTPMKSGKLQFDILWSGKPIPGSPFAIQVTDTSLVKVIDRDSLQTTVHVKSHVQVLIDTTAIEHEGTLTTRLMYSDSPPVSPEVTNNDGIYTVVFFPTAVGTPTLRFYWDKEELTNCAIKYVVLDTRKYRLTHLPADRGSFQTFESINFVVESEEGLPLEPLKLTAICGDIHIPFQFNDIRNNQGEAMFMPTLPGTYRIEVSCVERLVDGSPFEVTVVDPSKCILVTKPPKYLALNEDFEFLLDAKEAGEGTVDFTCLEVPDAFDSVVTSNPENSSVGVRITPRMLGEYLITFTHCDSEIPGCPIRLTVCNPSATTISGEILRTMNAIVGQPVTFTITNPNWTNMRPAVKIQGPTARYPVTLEEKTPEEFTVTFTPWELGSHEITITLGGYTIPSTPCQFTVITSTSAVCSATGSGLQNALTGQPAQFLVHAKSGLMEEGHLDIEVQSVVHGTLGKVRARDNNNGSYNVAYLVDMVGAYLVHVRAWGKHIPGSPFKVNVNQGPQAMKCSMNGEALDPNNLLKIGDPIEFSIDATRGGTGKLHVSAVGPKGAQARVFIARGKKPGLFDIQLDPIRSGKYRVSVKWSGQHIPNSPFLLRVFPGADASKCRAHGPGLQDGEVGQLSTFTIETKNAGSGVLKVRLNGIKNAFKVEIKPVSPQNVRTLIANYNPTKPGDYLISIKWSERDIPGSPFKVNIGGQAQEERSQNNLLLATPSTRELHTIPEEYEDSESMDHVQTRHSRPKSHRSLSPHINGDIPIFRNNMSINYRNNFATKSPTKRGGPDPHIAGRHYSGRAKVKMGGAKAQKKSLLKKR